MQNATSSEKQKKRPLSVTLLTWVVLIMASLNWLQLAGSLSQWAFLQSLSPGPPVFYLAITGLLWGLLGTALVWGLLLGRRWAYRLMQIGVIIYTIYYWIDRLIIADPFAIANRWPFALGLTIILLIFTCWALSRPKTRIFFEQTQT